MTPFERAYYCGKHVQVYRANSSIDIGYLLARKFHATQYMGCALFPPATAHHALEDTALFVYPEHTLLPLEQMQFMHRLITHHTEVQTCIIITASASILTDACSFSHPNGATYTFLAGTSMTCIDDRFISEDERCLIESQSVVNTIVDLIGYYDQLLELWALPTMQQNPGFLALLHQFHKKDRRSRMVHPTTLERAIRVMHACGMESKQSHPTIIHILRALDEHLGDGYSRFEVRRRARAIEKAKTTSSPK